MNELLEQIYNQSFEDELNKISAFKGQEIFKRLNPIKGKNPLFKILSNNKGSIISQKIPLVKGLEEKVFLAKNIPRAKGLTGNAIQSTNIRQVKGLTS